MRNYDRMNEYDCSMSLTTICPRSDVGSVGEEAGSDLSSRLRQVELRRPARRRWRPGHDGGRPGIPSDELEPATNPRAMTCTNDKLGKNFNSCDTLDKFKYLLPIANRASEPRWYILRIHDYLFPLGWGHLSSTSSSPFN